MGRNQSSEGSLIFIKCVEPDGWRDLLAKTPINIRTKLHPFGTVNADDEFTKLRRGKAEEPCVIDTDYARGEPYRGSFEPLVGKSEVNFPDEYEKEDIANPQHPKDFGKGDITFDGSLSVTKEQRYFRMEGIHRGWWQAVDASMSFIGKLRHWPYFRKYEIWVFEGLEPEELSLRPTKAPLLTKHYFIVFAQSTKTLERIMKGQYPISRRGAEEFIDYDVTGQNDTELLTAGDLSQTTLTLTTPIGHHHTRLQLEITTIGAGSIELFGKNVLGEPIECEIDIAATDTDRLVHEYFAEITEIRPHDFVTGDVITIKDYDYKMR